MWILYSLHCNTWRYRRKFQRREDIVKLSCFLRLSTRMHVNANANEKKLTLSFTLGCENVGTWLCVLSSRDTYLSTGANRNVFIATAVCKIERLRCTTILGEANNDRPPFVCRFNLWDRKWKIIPFPFILNYICNISKFF